MPTRGPQLLNVRTGSIAAKTLPGRSLLRREARLVAIQAHPERQRDAAIDAPRVVHETGRRHQVVLRHVRAQQDLHLRGHAVVERRDAVAGVAVAEHRRVDIVDHVLAADPERVAAAPAGLGEAQGTIDLRAADAVAPCAKAPPRTVFAPTSAMRGAVLLNVVAASE